MKDIVAILDEIYKHKGITTRDYKFIKKDIDDINYEQGYYSM